MIIDDFNIARITVIPMKTDAKLVVDSHAKLPNPITL